LYLIGSSGVVLAIARGFTGVGCSVGYISGIFIAVKYFPAKRLPIFVSLVEGVSTLGAMLATTAFNKLLTNFGWDIANASIVVLCLVLLILSVLFGWTINYQQKVKSSFIQAMKQGLFLLKNKPLLAVFIYSFCTWLIIMSFAGYWIKNYMIAMHGYNVEDALALASIYWGAFFVANMTVGFFVESLRACKIALLILAFISLINYIYMSVPVLFNYHQLVLVSVIGGFASSGVIMAFSIIPKIVSSELSGTALAVNNTFIILGGYVGQVLFGYLVDKAPFFEHNELMHAHHIELHYYNAILIYPLFAFIGVVAVFYVVYKLE
jgi:MFS family permease